jgi:hypothetical protein
LIVARKNINTKIRTRRFVIAILPIVGVRIFFGAPPFFNLVVEV